MATAHAFLEDALSSSRDARWSGFAATTIECRGLTERERDVLQWLSSGATDRQIASHLRLSPRTVHKHLEHVYRKLGVATRTAAVMYVVNRCLDERGPPSPISPRPSD